MYAKTFIETYTRKIETMEPQLERRYYNIFLNLLNNVMNSYGLLSDKIESNLSWIQPNPDQWHLDTKTLIRDIGKF
jgi:hypothetical protein